MTCSTSTCAPTWAGRARAPVPRCCARITKILDRDRRPAYLEASGARTRRIYLHHGYTDQGAPIQFPGGPAIYPMVRQSRPLRGPAAAA
jgi:hypothetical protein